ncbi:MAG TPA: DUF6492 family protein [Fontimonas sp.]
MTPSSSELCFITPTYRQDFDRFRLLRESIVAFGQGHIRHYALIGDEDLALLQGMNLPNVVPVTIASLLDPEIEAGRVAYNNSGGRMFKRWQRSLHKRFGWFPNARYYGWQTQQLLKLAAPALLPERVFVSFDSDMIVCGHFGLDDFIRDGQVALYERRFALDHPMKPTSWHGLACRLADQPVPTQPGDETADYVGLPFVFEKSHALALQAWLEQRYGQPWWRTILDLPLCGWSEFMIYGEFVRSRLHYQGVFRRPVRANTFWIEHPAQFRHAETLIRQAFADPQMHFLCLQADDHGVWTLDRFSAVVNDCIAEATGGKARMPARPVPTATLAPDRRFDLARAGAADRA